MKPLATAAALSAADDVFLQCSSNNTSSADPTKLAQATLSATLAGTLHATGGATP